MAGNPPTESVDLVNILIVDDEPKNLTVLETVLDDPGYRLVRANSGEEALLKVVANDFALLVLDIRMPRMTGFELAHMVKERKKSAFIPIIFLTAYYNEDQHVLEGYGSGGVDYLHKPINATVLRSKVAVFAELYRKSRAIEAANRSLYAEISERRDVEARLRELNETLDRRVVERTEALQASEARLRDASRRKDEFLATLGHELRNPMAPIRNAAQILRLKIAQAPDLLRSVEVIERQVRAMSRMLDDLMDVNRINQGKFELRRERAALDVILHDAIEATRGLIDEFDHQLTLDIPSHGLLIDGDPARLSQAFVNLLNNAAKYTDKRGRIGVTVKTHKSEVLVSIVDSGIGIAAERLENVFEMFSQVEEAVSRSRGGLGIGLALTRRLIELHGGSVRAHSAGLGCGSRLEVSLPLADEQRVEAAAESLAIVEPERAQASAGLRILLADDNRDGAASLAELLMAMGHEVRQVHDGAAAVEAAIEYCPQLTLLDIGMPKLNGFEACRQIRAQAGGKAMTLVAITGWGQLEDRRKSQEAGFDHHFVKPMDLESLSDLLADLTARG
ncbi:MAG: response regulator [Burkholderiaceae bacterium]